MEPRALGSLLIGVVMVVCLVGTGSAIHQPSERLATDHTDIGGIGAQQYAGNAPAQEIRIAVRPNGSGIVTVRYRIPLTDANETTAFERLRANITSNPSWYRTRFDARMNRVVASAEATTGRQMAITNLTVNATRRGTTGIITYSFLWTHIAATDGTHLRIGDALTGLYLDNGTQLVIAWPDEYELATVRPAPNERQRGAVRWSAPTTFGTNEPFVELTPVGSSTTSPDSPNVSNASDSADGDSETNPALTVSFVIVLVGVLGVVVWLRRQRRRDEGSQSPTDEPAATTTDANGDDTGPSESTAATVPQADLISNEERLLRALERAGGRAKQRQIVEELGWTEAKTSRVVSALREEGTITGFRLGRENVLALPEDDLRDNENASK